MKGGVSLEAIARAIPGAELVGESVPVFGVRHESRRTERGDLFVVRPGARHDGTPFVPHALAAGAAALLVSKRAPPLDVDVPVVRVDDIASGLAKAANVVYGDPSSELAVVGITGTNGKTTISYLTRAAVGSRCGIIGTIGHTFADRAVTAEHTTPEADELARVMAAMKNDGATHVAMEVSSMGLALGRTLGTRFRVAAFSNLTQDHLDFHGSFDAYAAAKLELFTAAAPAVAVVNVDDPFGVTIAGTTRANVVRIRTRPSRDADVAPENLELSPAGIRMTMRTPRGAVEIATPLVGAHNVENIAIALGIAVALDLDVEVAARAIAAERGAPGRLERCHDPGDDVAVYVDYAHTEDALRRVLGAVEPSLPGGRVWCVFGAGGDRDPAKRAPMGRAVGELADVAIVTSDNPRSEDPIAIAAAIVDGLLTAGLERTVAVDTARRAFAVELDRSRAIALAVASARPGDVVLIAGKGHETHQIIGAERHPFDDRAEARAAVARRRSAE
jgi:UDP-N-acetylmuramoyl-L-alanyl-D-glutamate--2,6-diaminopimelate ligase